MGDQAVSERGVPGPRRLSRNLNELLQELRVVQPGVQILSAFLLTVPFSARFGELTAHQRTTFLIVLSGSLLTTVLMMAPVAFHRTLFRQQRRHWIVEAANNCTRAGLAALGVTMVGALYLVFDVVADRTAAVIALVVGLVIVVGLWWAVPTVMGRPRREDR